MSTVILVEQRPPFILMLASRVPTYTHIIISLLAALLFQAFPAWAITKPPVREITRKRRSSSLTSNTTTLVDSDEFVDAAKPTPAEKKKRHHISFSDKIPFKRLGSFVKPAFSSTKSMNFKSKLPRRLSLPARRFSSSVISAFHHLTPRHRHLDEETDSYFSENKVDLEINKTAEVQVVEVESSSDEVPVPTIVEGVAQPQIEVEMVESEMEPDVACASENQVPPPGKRASFKRVARRVSVILKFTPRR